jgi:hypothetical protein
LVPTNHIRIDDEKSHGRVKHQHTEDTTTSTTDKPRKIQKRNTSEKAAQEQRQHNQTMIGHTTRQTTSITSNNQGPRTEGIELSLGKTHNEIGRKQNDDEESINSEHTDKNLNLKTKASYNMTNEHQEREQSIIAEHNTPGRIQTNDQEYQSIAHKDNNSSSTTNGTDHTTNEHHATEIKDTNQRNRLNEHTTRQTLQQTIPQYDSTPPRRNEAWGASIHQLFGFIFKISTVYSPSQINRNGNLTCII